MAKKIERTATVKDMQAVRKQIARMANKWGWSVKEFEEYLLRMGVNRVMALERYNSSSGKAKKAPKKATRKATPKRKAAARKAAPKRKATARKAPVKKAAETNHAPPVTSAVKGTTGSETVG